MLKIEIFNTFIKIKYDKFNHIIQSIINQLTFDYNIAKTIEIDTRLEVTNKLYELYKHNKEIKQLVVPYGALKYVLRLCNNFNIKHELVNRQINNGVDLISLKLTADMKPREYQELYIRKLIEPTLSRFLLVDLKPGAGKTFIAVNVALRLKKRIALIILPKYIDKWIDDFKKYCGISKKKIRIIQGLDSIRNVIEGERVTEDVVICSVRTCTLYIEQQNKDQDTKPITLFFNKANIGTAILDEVHQETFAVARILMYSNIYKVIGLSATFMPNHDEESRLYGTLFKDNERLSNLVTFEKYINIYGIKYLARELNTNYIKNRVFGNYGYSHVKMEQIIGRTDKFLIPYFEMIYNKLEIFFINEYKNKDKCLIYFSLVDFCTRFQDWLRNKLREEKIKLKVGRYIAVDPWENLLNNNIVITTLGSAGTAVDIPNLTTVINTVVIKSKKLNIQNVGRLRQIPDREVNYIYFYTELHSRTEMIRKQNISHMAKTYIHDTYQLKIDHSNLFQRSERPKYTPEQRWEYFKRNNAKYSNYFKK